MRDYQHENVQITKSLHILHKSQGSFDDDTTAVSVVPYRSWPDTVSLCFCCHTELGNGLHC